MNMMTVLVGSQISNWKVYMHFIFCLNKYFVMKTTLGLLSHGFQESKSLLYLDTGFKIDLRKCPLG